jgi:hypothetical protein
MLHRTPIVTRTLLLAPMLIYFVGCSADDGLGSRYSVSGTVKYKGAPVPKATINFSPSGKDTAKPGASGTVTDGNFTLTTLTPGDGALPGEYKVTISAREADDARLKEETAKFAKKHGMGKMEIVPQEIMAKVRSEWKPTIPVKYENPQTSELKATVKEESNSFTFELTD